MKRSNSLSYRSIIVIVCLAFLSVSVSCSDPEYYDPPVPTVTHLFALTKSTADNVWIGSERVQNLDLVQKTVNSKAVTQFTLNILDQSQISGKKTYTKSIDGTWKYIKGTSKTLSCSFVYESTSKSYGILYFQSDSGLFGLVGPVTFTAIKAYVSNNALTQAQLEAGAEAGENCQAGSFLDNIIRVSPDFTSAAIVTLPKPWSIKASGDFGKTITSDFNYAVSNNQLYKYNLTTNTFDSKYIFSGFTNYIIKSFGTRIIVAAISSEVDQQKLANKIVQKFFFFEDRGLQFKFIRGVEYTGYSTGSSFTAFFSPQLTKVGFYYFPLDFENPLTDFAIVFLSADYKNALVSEISLDNQFSFVTAVLSSKGIYHFGDNFIILRDDTAKKEYAYQYVGSKLIQYSSRDVSGASEATIFKVMADSLFPTTLVAVEWYKTATGYDFQSVQYSNYAATKRIKPATIPPLSQFSIGSGTQYVPARYSTVRLNYLKYAADIGNTISTKQVKIGAFGNIVSTETFFKKTNFKVEATSANCMIVSQLQNETTIYALLKFNSTTKVYDSIDLSDIVGDTNSFIFFKVSENCEKFSVNLRIFYSDQSGIYKQVGNILSDFNWTTVDKNFFYVQSPGLLWKYNQTTFKYDNIFQFPSNLPERVEKLYTYNNRILIYFNTGTLSLPIISTIGFAAGIQINGTLKYLGFKALTSLTQFAVSVSPDASKVFVKGKVKQIYSNFLWHIDYNSVGTNSFKTVDVPLNDYTRDPLLIQYNVFDSYLYVRHALNQDVTDAVELGKPFKHFLYFLKAAQTPVSIFSKELTDDQKNGWMGMDRTAILGNSLVTYLITLNKVGSEYVIPKYQFNPTVASLSANQNLPYSGYLKDGKLQICHIGCSDCSSGECTACKKGFVLNPDIGICLACAPGCTACLASNINSCSACLDNLFLDGSTCTACNANCATCSVTQAKCSSCSIGKYLDISTHTCKNCPSGCSYCTNQVYCKTCQSGYVITKEFQCRPCSPLCKQCNKNDSTKCTACPSGSQLINGACKSCPANCVTCAKGICTKCASEYTLKEDGTACIANCHFPCSTCVIGKPLTCTSCFASSVLNGTTCVIDDSCNETAECTDCGQGFNYYLSEGQCLPCSSISNCLQCSSISKDICSLCSDGYYLTNDGACNKCGSGCKICSTDVTCKTCTSGYVLSSSSSTGSCIACDASCATCEGVPTFCTSCPNGSFLKGWKCIPNDYVAFGWTFPTTSSTSDIHDIIDQIIVAILTALKEDINNLNAVSIESVKAGSVVVSGTVVQSTGTSSAASATLINGLNSVSSIGGLQVSPVSVSVYSASSISTEDSKSSPNIALIAGITIGTIVFIVVVVIIIYCACKDPKTKRFVNPESSNIIQDSKEVIQVESLNGINSINYSRRR